MTAQQDADWFPRVFISYSHDSDEHKELVRRFGTFLRKDVGIDVHLDRWYDGYRLDWSFWADRHLREDDFIIVIASPEYRRRADGEAPPDEGRGARFEAAIIRNNLTRNLPAETRRVLPVVLPGYSIEDIPSFLNAYSTTHYVIKEFTLDGIAELLSALTGEPEHPMPERGPFVGSRRTNGTEVPRLRKPAGGILLTATLRPVQRTSDVRIGPADLNGNHYGDSIIVQPQLFAGESKFVIEYNLARQYRTFHTVVGVLDDAIDSGQVGYFQAFLDGHPGPQVRATLGETAVLRADVTGVLRLRLVCYRPGTVGNPLLAGARIAGGQSNHLPELAFGNPTLAK